MSPTTLDETVQIRMSSELKRACRIEAAKRDLSMSEWLRQLAADETQNGEHGGR